MNNVLEGMKEMLKPASEFGYQIQNESKVLLNKKKISNQDFMKLQVKFMYLQSIALQLQVQQLESVFEDME